MSEQRYIYEKYKTKATRYTCPKCGRPHCFTRYIDQRTGLPINERVGRCDHVQSCGYDYTPRQFFFDNPWERQDSRIPKQKTRYRNFNDYMRQQPKKEYRCVTWNAVEELAPNGDSNSFTDWFGKLFTEPQKAIEAAKSKYHISTFVNRAGERGVVFWQINKDNDVVDGKVMYYNPDGHRKQYMTWISAEYKKRIFWSEDVETKKCFFGEHLLYFSSKMTGVCLVESEKTALICSSIFPQFIWLATCGCANLNKETAEVLRGRLVVVFPDSGQEDKWDDVLRESRVLYKMVRDFSEYPPNTDVADLLLDGRLSIEQLNEILTKKFYTKWKT